MKKKVCALGIVMILGILTACGKKSPLPNDEQMPVSVSDEAERNNQQTMGEDNTSEAENSNQKIGEEEIATEGNAETAENTEDLDEEVDYYSVCTSYSKKEVEDFAYLIKQQVMNKEWSALAENIAYPITISSVTYETQEAFCAENWDDVLDDEFYKGIENESCTNMFCNYQGIMLGNGEIWISEVLDDNMKSQGLRIVAISK